MRKITGSALFTALIAVLAQISIPLPFSPVPFTGQVLGVMLAASLLGSKAAVLSVGAYLMLGAAGAPVFSLARGGMHILSGPTGGYLWGFIPAVFIAGIILEKSNRPSLYRRITAMLSALFMIYLLGTLQLSLVMGYSIPQAILIGVAPFLVFDLLKAALVVVLSTQIAKSLEQNGLGHFLQS